MNERLETSWQRFRQAPRAIQWAAYAAILMTGFLIWDGSFRKLGDEWSRRADRIEQRVKDVRDASKLGRDLRALRNTIASCGPVELPGSAEDGTEALNRTVTEVLKNYQPSNVNWRSGPDQKLPRSVLDDLTPGRSRIATIKGDLDFEAPWAEASAIIADLESNPQIELISSLSMTKTSGRKLKVRLALESWVLPSKEDRR